MRVRFQADADLNQIILLATIRREPAIDFQTAMTAALPGVADPKVLARAATDGRVLVTHDRKTMPRHFSEFISRETSSGLLVIPQSMSSSRCCWMGVRIRSVKPPACIAGQKRLPGRAKWQPTAAEYRLGLIPQKRTLRPLAITSGIRFPYAAAISSLDGLRPIDNSSSS